MEVVSAELVSTCLD